MLIAFVRYPLQELPQLRGVCQLWAPEDWQLFFMPKLREKVRINGRGDKYLDFEADANGTLPDLASVLQTVRVVDI